MALVSFSDKKVTLRGWGETRTLDLFGTVSDLLVLLKLAQTNVNQLLDTLGLRQSSSPMSILFTVLREAL